MKGRLGRRVLLLTGAGGHLGSAFCRRYGDRYDIVAIWHRRRPVAATQGQSLVDPLSPDGTLPANARPVHAVRADLRDPGDVERAVRTAVKEFGGVDVVVNAAVAGSWAPLLNGHCPMDELTDALRLNVVAPLALTAEVVRRCWRDDPARNTARNRCLVNISSTAGSYVYPGYGQGMYSAAKAALNILTRHLAAELEPLGVRANVLAPDTFPARVPMPRVLDGVVRLCEGSLTSRVLLLLPNGVEHVLGD